MATTPKVVTLTNSSVDILNAIRNNATQNYRDYVPKATPDADSCLLYTSDAADEL